MAKLAPELMSDRQLWSALDRRLMLLSTDNLLVGYGYREKKLFAAEARDVARELHSRGTQLRLVD